MCGENAVVRVREVAFERSLELGRGADGGGHDSEANGLSRDKCAFTYCAHFRLQFSKRELIIHDVNKQSGGVTMTEAYKRYRPQCRSDVEYGMITFRP